MLQIHTNGNVLLYTKSTVEPWKVLTILQKILISSVFFFMCEYCMVLSNVHGRFESQLCYLRGVC